MPEKSAAVRQAAVKRSSSARRPAERLRGFRAQQRRHGERVVAGGHQGGVAAEQRGVRAAFVDGEIVDHRLHGEGDAVFHGAFGLAHDGLQAALRFGFAFGAKRKPMPPPDMPPSIQKPQKSSPNSARARRISVSV